MPLLAPIDRKITGGVPFNGWFAIAPRLLFEKLVLDAGERDILALAGNGELGFDGLGTLEPPGEACQLDRPLDGSVRLQQVRKALEQLQPQFHMGETINAMTKSIAAREK